MKPKGILVIGSANIDMVVMTKNFPREGETIFGDNFGMFPGGKGANQAVACAKLGGKVYFLGKLGNDVFRDRLVLSMTQAGVIVEHLVVDRDGSTGIALITVDQKGENEIVVVSGSNMKLTAADVEKRGRVFSKASVLLVQLEIPLDTLIASVRMAKQKGLTVVLNPAPARRIPRKLLSMVDYLTPNASEAGILTGMEFNGVTGAKDVGQRLLSLGVGNVILTLGEKGCLLISRETQAKYPAFKVKPVDTTAAGDAFNGGLAFALARGDSTENAIRIARAVAAISVTRVGAQSSMPTLKEVEAFLS